MYFLSVQQTDAGMIAGSIRSVLWMIAKGCLLLLDGMFKIINEVWRFKFFDNEYVNNIFGGAIVLACSWICLKVMIEFIVNHIINKEDNNSPLLVFKGIILAIVVMFMVSPLFTLGQQFSVGLTDAVIKTTNMSDKTTSVESGISVAVIKSMANNNAMKDEDLNTFLSNWKTEDINKTTGGILGIGKVYCYDFNLFMMIVIAILTLFLLVFVGVQMAKRVIELALYKIISPMVATSLTNNKSKAFDTWLKGVIALFLVTAVQFICLGLLINSFSSIMKETDNVLTGLLFLVGSLLFVITSPQIISSLLGENIGAMSAYSDIQSSIMMASGVGMGLSVVKAGTLGALAKGSRVMSVIPKAGGNVSGMVDQFKNFKSNGNSGLMALAKTGASQVGSPIKSSLNSKYSVLRDVYRESRNSAVSRTIHKTSNPINFVERSDKK
jgi:hypothetical protein